MTGVWFPGFRSASEGAFAGGDRQGRLAEAVDFKKFRPILLRALRRSKRHGPDGRLSHDPMLQ